MAVAILNGTSLYYEREGSGQPIVFIHGHGLTHTMFKSQLEFFSEDYQVILCDLRGNGKSGRLMQSKEKVIETQGTDLIMLLNELNLRDAVFVGVSYGGLVAQYIAREYPERVKAVVVADSFCRGDSSSFSLIDKLQVAAAYCSWFTYYAPSELVLPSIRLMYQRWGLAYQVIRSSMLEKRPRELYKQRLAMARPDAAPFHKGYPHPALFLAGDGMEYGVLCMKDMAEQVPHAQFAVIPDALNPSNLCQPEIFNQLLSQFLEKVHLNRKRLIEHGI
ncbi:alpha/beta hydrolase [Paenibacillus sp. PK3_47]|uniref:alpha/beta fold hydrolase n=1 Tax=Paenibacillus sp. PK3_47 TaxID=2072642 RepID=UPI00201E1545|nr:alpha/beta hydrolase [Paenibacillus sp. PK3_47]